MQDSTFMTIGPYQITYKMNSWHMHDIYQGYNPNSNERVTLKFFNKKIISENNLTDAVENEINILNKVSHKNIIALRQIIDINNFVVVAVECLNNGTIITMKENSIFSMNECLYLKWCKDILEGLQYLHSNNISHHNLRPDAIGFDDDMNAKIIDLSLCEEFETLCHNKTGSLLFASPELIWDEEYDGVKSDIWSFGITLHYLVTGKLPFKDFKPFDTLESKESIVSNILNECPEPLNEIINLALCENPNDRPTAQELLDLPLFNTLNKNRKPSLDKNPFIKVPLKRVVVKTPIVRKNSQRRKIQM